jgi:hypothetical protein
MSFLGRGVLLVALLAVGAGPAWAAEVELAAPVEFKTGGPDGPVATVDFNKDGHLDAAVGDRDTDDVAVMLGDGAGTLALGSTADMEPAGAVGDEGIVWLVAADFNNDMNPDLAASLLEQGVVSVRLGNGMGGFGAPISTPSFPASGLLSVGDVNEDGNLDLAVGNDSNDSAILFGNGTGAFPAREDLVDAGRDPLLTDVNGDQNLDLAGIDGFAGTLDVSQGTGTGAFGPPQSSSLGPDHHLLFAPLSPADWDGNGERDLLYGERWFDRGSDGTYGIIGDFQWIRRSVAVDLNGDGVTDIFGTGDGTKFANPTNTVAYWATRDRQVIGGGEIATSDLPDSPAAGDLDGDGKPDGLASITGGRLAVFINLGAPDTGFTSGPPPFGYSTSRDVTFGFASSPAGSTFECSLDGAPFTACTSPLTLSNLSDGKHAFAVRARDAADDVDPSPATREFTVDATAPSAFALVSPPDGGRTSVQTVQLVWEHASDAVSDMRAYRVVVDGANAADVASELCSPTRCSLTVHLGGGEHTWQVTAFDRAGNSRNSSVGSFRVDTAAPAVPQLQSPLPGSTLGTATPVLSWNETTDDDAIDGYRVLIDGSVATTTGPDQRSFTTPALGEGRHSWVVEAVDRAGNASASVARTFVVDLTAPRPALRARRNPTLPGRVTLDASRSTDALTAVRDHEWDLDGNGSFERDTGSDPTTSRRYRRVGTHRIRVRVADAAGNRDTAVVRLRVRRRPPRGPVGISIDRGAVSTDGRRVRLSLVWPRYAYAALVANDGGFRRARRFAVRPTVRWRLPRGADGPRTVYVRYLGGPIGLQTFQDEILLDR